MSLGSDLRLVKDSGGHCASAAGRANSSTATAAIIDTDANRDIQPPRDGRRGPGRFSDGESEEYTGLVAAGPRVGANGGPNGTNGAESHFTGSAGWVPRTEELLVARHRH